jgi:hypothetical protein
MTRHDHALSSKPENPSRPDGLATSPGLADLAAKQPRAPLTQAILVDRACSRFEAAWRRGLAPRIEAILEDLSESGGDRALLLAELLALELELRQSAGECPSIGGYLERFPDHVDVVDRAFGDFIRIEVGPTAPAGEPPIFSRGLEPPRRFGDYELLGELARGGMGVVSGPARSASIASSR